MEPETPEIHEIDHGYKCPSCRDTGMRDGENGVRACDCSRAEVYWRGVSAFAGIPEIWHGTHFKTYEPSEFNDGNQTDAYKSVYAWAHLVWYWAKRGKKNPGGVLLYGPKGTGKSTLTAAAVNSLLRDRIGVAWVNAPRLYLEALEVQKSEHGGVLSLIDRYRNYQVLVLDDLGAEKASDFAQTIMYGILNDRAENDNILIATTNLDPGQGLNSELENRVGERNASRLIGLCDIVSLPGADLRAIK